VREGGVGGGGGVDMAMKAPVKGALYEKRRRKQKTMQIKIRCSVSGGDSRFCLILDVSLHSFQFIHIATNCEDSCPTTQIKTRNTKGQS
jgi:hypothetical protein